MWKKHPKALPFLFLSEMWERFGYYLMIGIFTLYLKDVESGFAMTEKEASDLYGTFIALVFLTPFIGGLIADRYLGYKKSIVIGGLMMGAGYFLMGIHNITMLYIAMTLVIVGNGFFKPNISTLLGNFYNDDKYKDKKDEGYNIFYMGINIGAFICNFFGAALQILLGWNYAFMAAGLGMFVGVIIFLLGTKYYGDKTEKKGFQEGDMPFYKIVLFILLPSLVFGVIGWLLGGIQSETNPNSFIFGSDSTDAFIFACIPVIFFYGSLYFKAKVEDKRPIGALLTIFAVVILFWAVFKLNGSALNTWADRYTDRQTERTLFGWEMPASYFQSVNPLAVIALAPIMTIVWGFLYARKLEPSSPKKMAIGLGLVALGYVVIAIAVKGLGIGDKVSMWWLIGLYVIHTIGELCLSPIGLSMVSKLAPLRLSSLMMGTWFLANAAANKFAGTLSALIPGGEDGNGGATSFVGFQITNLYEFFILFIIMSGVAAAILFILSSWLEKRMHNDHIETQVK